MSSSMTVGVSRHSLTTPLWVLAFLVSMLLPLASLAVAVAAISTTYRNSAGWKRALVVAAGVLVLAWQLSAFLPAHTSLHVGPATPVPVG